MAAGSTAYDYGTIRRPVAALLRGDGRVEEYRLVSAKRGTAVVEVRLGHIDDLKIAYEEIGAGLERILGPLELVIKDGRSPETVAFLQRAQFVLYEALQNGTFVEMEARLEQLARTAGLSVRVGISDELLFLHVESENGRLYEVIRRYPERGAGES